jgi:hypothetical protein
VADVPSGLSLTPPQETKIKQEWLHPVEFHHPTLHLGTNTELQGTNGSGRSSVNHFDVFRFRSPQGPAFVTASPFIRWRIIRLSFATQHNEIIVAGTGWLNKTRQAHNKSEMRTRSVMASSA